MVGPQPCEDLMREVERRLAALGDDNAGFDYSDTALVDQAVNTLSEMQTVAAEFGDWERLLGETRKNLEEWGKRLDEIESRLTATEEYLKATRQVPDEDGDE